MLCALGRRGRVDRCPCALRILQDAKPGRIRIVSELDFYICSKAWGLPIKPNFSRGSVSYLIGLAQGNVNATPCRFPPGNVADAEVLVSMSESSVMFVAIRILVSTSFRVSRSPKLLDEPFVFGIRSKQEERPLLFGGDYVSNILIHPSLIHGFEVRLDSWTAERPTRLFLRKCVAGG
jgi:hypothetical protein